MNYDKLNYATSPSRPPSWVWNRAVTELRADARTVFVYGRTIHTPSGASLDPPLLAHELTHVVQQIKLGEGDDEAGAQRWWERNFADAVFRYAQELAAHRRQYQVFCQDAPYRGPRLRFLHRIAADLAAPLYGGLVTTEQAIQAIRSQ